MRSAVEAFTERIGVFFPTVGQEGFQMTVNHLGYLLNWFEFAANSPRNHLAGVATEGLELYLSSRKVKSDGR